jgi:hypothetical protein
MIKRHHECERKPCQRSGQGQISRGGQVECHRTGRALELGLRACTSMPAVSSHAHTSSSRQVAKSTITGGAARSARVEPPARTMASSSSQMWSRGNSEQQRLLPACASMHWASALASLQRVTTLQLQLRRPALTGHVKTPCCLPCTIRSCCQHLTILHAPRRTRRWVLQRVLQHGTCPV